MIQSAKRKPGQELTKKYGIGVDIGGTKIIICIADLQGNIVYKHKVPSTSSYTDIHQHVKDALRAMDIYPEEVAAVGFGVPGITDSYRGTIIDAPAFKWKNEPFLERMQQYFNCPIFVDNDVNCAAQGEHWLGSTRNIENFVLITIGTGVGSAIFSNGSIVQGEQFMAGEIGYFLSDRDIEKAHTNLLGEFGIFEKKTSGTALSRHGYEPRVLFQNYKQGDRVALEVINQFVTNLALAIANITSLLNPNKVVIGGGVSSSMGIILDKLRLKVSQFTPIPVTIELSALGEESGAVGALAFALVQTGLYENNKLIEPYGHNESVSIL
ncbi:ROK family protein [Bacillus sp. FJAT-27245]|uniref:ROK family protein n=1 Tax=Bacillus sp. FJAT-27245 TaxID=1684144 RepID=UPI0006A7D754|nr:ROK family protein [Bacillus sp. FJAT-27245]